MSIKRSFICLSVLIIIAMTIMASMIWYSTNNMAELGYKLALSKELSNNIQMLRRHEKDFLLRKDLKHKKSLMAVSYLSNKICTLSCFIVRHQLLVKIDLSFNLS